MSAHLTEEEQLEALKRWWNENGKSTIVGIAVVVAGYFGWQGWHANQQRQAEMASNSYQNIMEALQVTPGQPLSDEKRSTVVHLSEGLKNEHPGNLYASQAALFLAKLAVENEELDKAVTELQWVIDHNVDETLARLAKYRLARVFLAQENYDAALEQVADNDSGTFKSLFAESRGDILFARGEVQKARAAYELAQQSMTEADRTRMSLLLMKIDDLKAPDVMAATSEDVADDDQDKNNEAGEY